MRNVIIVFFIFVWSCFLWIDRISRVVNWDFLVMRIGFFVFWSSIVCSSLSGVIKRLFVFNFRLSWRISWGLDLRCWRVGRVCFLRRCFFFCLKCWIWWVWRRTIFVWDILEVVGIGIDELMIDGYLYDIRVLLVVCFRLEMNFKM